MNLSPERNLRLRASRFAIVVMTLLCIAALFVPTLSAQVAPAGAVIGNQATATYLDANSVSRTAFSNLVQTTVSQIYSGTLVAAQTKWATPGSQVLFPHTYTNTGNGPDAVTFTLTAVSGEFTANTAHVYMDANGDGIPDNTTDLVTTALPIAAGASIKVVVVATVAPGTAAAQTPQLTVNSSAHAGGVLNNNIDTVTVTSNGVINVTKAMSAASVGGVSTVTLTYTNTGNATATNVVILDPLKTEGYFTYNVNSAAINGVAFTDAAPPATLTWTGYAAATNAPQATILSVAPGVTGVLTYNVTVGTPASYPATFTNYAQYQYVDGGGNTIPGAASYTNTNTVVLAFNGIADPKFTSGTATFVKGNPTSGTATNTSPATSIIPSSQYTQGATIVWSQVITNQGQLTDTYNMTLDTAGSGANVLDPTIPAANQFPAGTTFQLYRTDGKTPLTDSNGDGIVDSGPVLASGTATIVVAATLPSGYTLSASTTLIVNLLATSTNATASNFVTPGLQDGVQDEVIISSTKNTTVDLGANAGDTIGNGTGVSGESAGPYSGNPGTTIAVPFWIFNTTTSGGAPDSYNLSYRYNGNSVVGNLATPLTAFTAAQAGTVPGTSGNIPAWTVQIAPNASGNCATYGAPVTASNVIAAAGNAEYCLLLQVPAGYAANPYYFTIQAQSNSTGALDQMAVKASVNTYHSVSINPNNQATIYAGGTVVYKHVVTNGGNFTETAVSLGNPANAGPTGWTVSAYLDGGNVGTLTSAATSIVTPYTIPTIAPGASIAYFLVVQAPASANPGDQELTTWTLTLAGNQAPTGSNSVTDTSTVANGQVKLVKSQNYIAHTGVSTCAVVPGAFSTSPIASAVSKDCIFYQIVATNTGTTNVTVPSVTDTAPPFTTPYALYNGGKPLFTSANCTSVLTDPAPAFNGNNSFTGTYAASPAMTPGCTITVVFEVQLN